MQYNSNSLANLSNFDTRIERLALDIAKKTENHLLSDGKSPNGIAAATFLIRDDRTTSRLIYRVLTYCQPSTNSLSCIATGIFAV